MKETEKETEEETEETETEKETERETEETNKSDPEAKEMNPVKDYLLATPANRTVTDRLG